MTESQRFLEIDKLRVSKLDKLRFVENELETERAERVIAVETLAREKELNMELVDQNRALCVRLESISAQFAAEKAALISSVEQSVQSDSGRISELEGSLNQAKGVIESLKQDLANQRESHSILEVENKSLKAALATKQADFNLQLDRVKRELTETASSKDKLISEQRTLIDQLSNSMSEAATQIIESQNISKLHSTELEARDQRIRALEEKSLWLEDNVRERTDRLIAEEDIVKELKKQIDQLIRENEIVLAQLESTNKELKEKSSIIQSMETRQKKSDLIQTNLVSELQSLPIINKRLESDCAFLRDDLKSVADKLKTSLKENQNLNDRLKIIDSILSPEQRLRVNEKAPITNSSSGSETKRLQIESMELRMRLVDSQAARDKAQAQLIEMSQLIGKLQKELKSDNENLKIN